MTTPSNPPAAGTSKQVELAQLSFARLLFALLRQRFTGTVVLDQRQPEPGRRTIWMRGGMPVFTDWHSPPDVLGEVLLARNLVTQQAFHQALAAMAKSGGLLGQVLMSQDALDFAKLSDALKIQCTRKLLKVFELREGSVTVTVGEHHLGNGDELSNQVNTLGLIRLGVQRHYDEARVAAEMGSALRGPLASADALAKYAARFGFHTEDRHLLDALQRGGTIDEIAVAGVSRRRLLQVAYTLWSCQMVLTGEAAAQAMAARKSVAPSRPSTPPPPPAAKAQAQAPAPAPAPTSASASASASVPVTEPAASAPPSSAPPARPAKASSAPPGSQPATQPSSATPSARSSTPASSPPGSGSKKAKKAPPLPPDPADGEFGQQLHTFETLIAEGAHAFKLFGLGLEAGRKEVRAVWAELSKAFHPDSLESRGLSHLHDRVERVFAAISEANSTLQNKDAREKLKTAVEMGGTGDVAEDPNVLVRNALEGEMLARDADKLLRGGSFQRALELYEKSLELSGNDPDVLAAVSWCRYQVAGRTDVTARIELEALAKVSEDAPMNAKPLYYQGLMLSALNDLTKAQEALKKAVSLDRRNTDAERHLRAVTIKIKAARQAAKAPEKKSLTDSLKGLFKK